MSRHQVLSVFALVLCGSLVAAQGIQSGPRAGSTIPGLFPSLVVFHAESADHAGKEWDFTDQPLIAGDGLKSGPGVAKRLPGPFHPLAVLHAEDARRAGTKWDFTEQYGGQPYVLIFARTISEPLSGLLVKLDAEMAKHREAKSKKVLGLVVMLSDEDAMEKQLREFGERLKIKHISLATDNGGAGPPDYRIAREADITLLLVNRRKIEANYAFKKDELGDRNVKQIVGDLQKIVKGARNP